MEEIELSSWSEFGRGLQQIDELRDLREKKNDGRHLEKAIIRGLGNCSWRLETTLERSFPMERSDGEVSLLKYYLKISKSQPAVESMTGTRWQDLPDYPAFCKLLKSDHWLDRSLRQHNAIYEYFIYLRHHGYPSPLLDWTASPWVAAFFAFDAMEKNATHVGIYALLQDTRPSISGKEHLFVVGRYITTHPRHHLQQSRYSMCVRSDPKNNKTRRDYLFLSHDDALGQGLNRDRDLMVKLKIPAGERRVALEQLDLMNINPHSLFGSEDSLIRTVARRQCLFENWNLP